MMIQQAAWLEEVHTGDFPGRLRAACQKRCLEKALVHRSSFAVCILNLPVSLLGFGLKRK